jgi:glucosamine-6-phosphate deaminase
MKVIVTKDYAEMSRVAADYVVALSEENPAASIVWPTGTTPLGAAQELAKRKALCQFDPSHLRFIQLDEYAGLPEGDPRTLFGWMDRALLRPLQICECNMVRFDANARDLDAACRAYDHEVCEGGGIDLCVLGLGPNGHIGFNEPPAPPDAPTRPIALTAETVESNASYWGGRERVPLKAVTAGMGRLLEARHILLLVSGAHKREILQKVLTGPVSPLVPASFLRGHSNVTIIADKAALPL